MTEQEQVIANLLFMKKDCLEDSDNDRTIDRAVKLLKEQETAVPIEPLCRYLEVYARTPIYNMRHTAEWWKEELNRQKWEKWVVKQHE